MKLDESGSDQEDRDLLMLLGSVGVRVGEIVVAVESVEDLTLARKVLDGVAEQMDHVPVPLSLGVVHARSLGHPPA